MRLFKKRKCKCMFEMDEIFKIDDPKCIYCGKKLSDACKDKGIKNEWTKKFK